MTPRHPDAWAFLLLAAAIFRTYRLVAADTITARWREYLTGYMDTGHESKRMTPPWRRPNPDHTRATLGQHKGFRTFLACRWCSGWWISVAWWVAWLAFPAATLLIAVPFALSTVSALVSKNLDAE